MIDLATKLQGIFFEALNAVPVLAEPVPQSVADPVCRGDTQQYGEARESTNVSVVTSEEDRSRNASQSSHSCGGVQKLASQLGVTVQSLHDLGAFYCTEYLAWAFPMSLPSGETVGFRLRSESGHKWSVKGSISALFIPFPAYRLFSNRRLFICEGPTDTAAALTLGLFAIGRPACLGCEEMVSQLLRDLSVREAVIVCDNDEPGIRGAERLRKHLRCPVAVLIPPTKDLREFVAVGGTAKVIDAILGNCIWNNK